MPYFFHFKLRTLLFLYLKCPSFFKKEKYNPPNENPLDTLLLPHLTPPHPWTNHQFSSHHRFFFNKKIIIKISKRKYTLHRHTILYIYIQTQINEVAEESDNWWFGVGWMVDGALMKHWSSAGEWQWASVVVGEEALHVLGRTKVSFLCI